MWKKVSFVVMTLFLAVAGVVNCGNVSYAQKVRRGDIYTFPDKALRKIITANFKESRIETDDVKEIVIGSYTEGYGEFDEEVLNIESLKGLELFTNLEKLVIIPGSVEEFSYTHTAENEQILNSLTHLKQIEFADCTIKGSDIKLALPNLQTLMLGDEIAGAQDMHSTYQSLDVSQCPNLKKLNCWGDRKLTKLVLPEGGKLEYLACGKTGLSTITNLDKHTKLKVLGCSYTKISKLQLSKMTKLRELYCRNTKIKKLDVRKNKNLRMLEVDASSTKKILYPSLMPKWFGLQLFKMKKNRSMKNYLPKGYRYIKTEDAAIGTKLPDAYNPSTGKMKKVKGPLSLTFKKKKRSMYVEFMGRYGAEWRDDCRKK